MSNKKWHVILTAFAFISSAWGTENPDLKGYIDQGLSAVVDIQFSDRKVDSQLQILRQRTDFPHIPLEEERPKISDLNVDSQLISTFKQLEKYFLGRQGELELLYCEDSDCGMTMNSTLKEVYVNPNFVRKHKFDVVKLALAHEIAHYIQELYVYETGSSLHGLPSYSAAHRVEREKQVLSSEEIKNISVQALAHTEVDFYATKAIRDLGHQVPVVDFLELLRAGLRDTALNNSLPIKLHLFVKLNLIHRIRYFEELAVKMNLK